MVPLEVEVDDAAPDVHVISHAHAENCHGLGVRDRRRHDGPVRRNADDELELREFLREKRRSNELRRDGTIPTNPDALLAKYEDEGKGFLYLDEFKQLIVDNVGCRARGIADVAAQARRPAAPGARHDLDAAGAPVRHAQAGLGARSRWRVDELAPP